MNLASLLIDHPAADHEGLLHTSNATVTAGEARATARAVARDLTACGVPAGSPVAVQLSDGPATVEAMFGVWLTDAVLVPVNPRLAAAEVDQVLNSVRPAAIVAEDGVRPLTNCSHHDPDVAFVTWTSGTSGEPKAVLHTHTGYRELLDRVLGSLGAPGERKTNPMPNLVPVPLTLNAGIYNVLFGLRAGAPLVLMPEFSTHEFAELVARFEIRSTVLPPAAMVMLNDENRLETLSPLRYVRSITAPLSPLQARRFQDRFGVTVLNGYGQAEVGEVIGWTAANAREYPEKLGAVGKPHPGVQIRIADGDEDNVGELMVKPPRMASGYANDDALAARIDHDGYLRTGDLARIDHDGFVWIEGRLGDVINRGGNKVFPDHVEEVLRLSPAVRDAAVVGAPDNRLGEVPVAFVQTAGWISDADLADLCRSHLVAYKVPVAFHRVDSLPRNEAGKLQRSALAAGLEARS